MLFGIFQIAQIRCFVSVYMCACARVATQMNAHNTIQQTFTSKKNPIVSDEISREMSRCIHTLHECMQ